MYATLQFIVNTIASLANWIYTNPVCVAGFVLVAINIFCYLFDQVKKLL